MASLLSVNTQPPPKVPSSAGIDDGRGSLVRVRRPAPLLFDEIRGTNIAYDSAQAFPMGGKTFAHYAVLRKAGAGWQGCRICARGTRPCTAKFVALKLPSTNNLTDRGVPARALCASASSSLRLNHPQISTIMKWRSDGSNIAHGVVVPSRRNAVMTGAFLNGLPRIGAYLVRRLPTPWTTRIKTGNSPIGT